MIRVFRLPLRVGAMVTLAACVVLVVLTLLPFEVGVVASVSGAAIIGLVAYLVVKRHLSDGLRKIERQLVAIRENNSVEVETVDGRLVDELAALSQVARQSGVAVQAEMEELKKIETYRRDFIGNVSHELKTPIFAIKGFSETLLGGALEDHSVNRSFVEKILRNAERLDNLGRDLSEISRIETGELKMEILPFSLSRTVVDVIESLEPRATEKRIVLKSVVSSDLPPALGDGERIRQVLVNLVDNAIKYSNSGGAVEVVVRAVDAHRIKVSVADNGIGVATDQVHRLTERFYRVDKSRSRSQGGTGLGLSIVKHILSAHGEKLQVCSTEGKGSTFGFALDAAPTDADDREVHDRHTAV